MRLRTTLGLSFGLVSVIQVAAVAPMALRSLDRTLTQQLAARIALATTAAQAELERTQADVRHSMDELAQSEALERFGREDGNEAARALMAPRALQILSLFDAEGRTLSSGHLPARLGDLDAALFTVTKAPADQVTPVRVEIRGEAGPRLFPALVTARSFEQGDHHGWAVGGLLLDQRAADRLARLTGARVQIRSGGEVIAAAGEGAAYEEQRVLALPPAAEVVLAFSRADLEATETGVLSAFLALFGLGLSLAVAVGAYLARRFTRPVEALTQATARVAAGALDARVSEPSTGELGALVDAFNTMTANLETTTAQLVASERVAAWQEVARRLAHEIKNPLTPIKMSLETLIAARDSHPEQFAKLFNESAGAVLEEVERLRRIVDEFSRFARLAHPTLARLDLGALAEQVLALYKSPPDGIALSSTLEEGVWVNGDRDQLTQVMVNLIKNAEEALPDGGKIWVRVRAEKSLGVFEVEDSGKGLAVGDRERIFEPYFTTKASGTGLGLAIASRIAQEHGGRLSAGGAPGAGALFSLRLPVT